jgi:hypothetical protein
MGIWDRLRVIVAFGLNANILERLLALFAVKTSKKKEQ